MTALATNFSKKNDLVFSTKNDLAFSTKNDLAFSTTNDLAADFDKKKGHAADFEKKSLADNPEEHAAIRNATPLALIAAEKDTFLKIVFPDRKTSTQRKEEDRTRQKQSRPASLSQFSSQMGEHHFPPQRARMRTRKRNQYPLHPAATSAAPSPFTAAAEPSISTMIMSLNSKRTSSRRLTMRSTTSRAAPTSTKTMSMRPRKTSSRNSSTRSTT